MSPAELRRDAARFAAWANAVLPEIADDETEDRCPTCKLADCECLAVDCAGCGRLETRCVCEEPDLDDDRDDYEPDLEDV